MAGTRICVVSGSRADYGLLLSPMRLIRDDPELELQLAVTGSHLAEDFGATAREIEADGFTINARVAIPSSASRRTKRRPVRPAPQTTAAGMGRRRPTKCALTLANAFLRMS